MTTFLLPWGCLWVLLTSACGSTPNPTAQRAAPSVSHSLPQTPVKMERVNLDGESVALQAYLGQVVVVTYFATWCIPCARLVSLMDRLANGTQAIKGLRTLPISVDRRPKSVLPDFVKSQRIRGMLVLGNRAERRGRTPFGRIDGLPTTFLIDPQGIPVEKWVGEVPAAYLRRRIATLLEEQK
ncbi:MAG: TlpA disulfide reductase family protein [Myxococcota bacterium]|nr:TlpA disulfide reductase family protein [Myxococcota bacterium]